MRYKIGAVADFFWGDRSRKVSVSRIFIKIAVCMLAACAVHESISAIVFQISKEELEGSRSSVDSAMSKAQLRSKFGLSVVSEGGATKLQYSWRRENAVASGSIFTIEKELGVISHPKIEDSVDVMTRRLERIEFMSSPDSFAESKLCFGSSKQLSADQCSKTAQVRAALNDRGVGGIISKVRIFALVLGPVQWLTLVVFFFALQEALGLWIRWVSPKSKLLPDVEKMINSLPKGNDDAYVTAAAKSVDELHGSRGVGILDRFFVKAISVSASDMDDDQRRNAVREALSNYRDYLQDDATARQDILDVLSDTMLKVAFMGTVFGISVSLFSARELDSAEPLVRMTAKSYMYAGIGMGFGATLVGIVLSIVSAKFKNVLFEAWSSKINQSYRWATEFNERQLYRISPKINDKLSVPLAPVPRARKDSDGLDLFLIVCGFVFAVIVLLFLLNVVRKYFLG